MKSLTGRLPHMFKCKTLSGDETLGRLCDYALNHSGSGWPQPHLFCFELHRERGDTWPFTWSWRGGRTDQHSLAHRVFKKWSLFATAARHVLHCLLWLGLVDIIASWTYKKKKNRPFSESGWCIKCNVKTLVWSRTEFNTLLSAVLMIHTRDIPLLT